VDIRVARSGHAGRDTGDRGRQGLISPLDRRDHVQVRTVNVDSHGMESRNWATVGKSKNGRAGSVAVAHSTGQVTKNVILASGLALALALALALVAEEMNVTNGHALTTGMGWEFEWRCRGGNGRAAKKQNKSRQDRTGSYRPPPSTAALMGLDSFRPQGWRLLILGRRNQGRIAREDKKGVVCVAHEHCNLHLGLQAAGICCGISTYHITSPLGEREHARGFHKKLKRENAASDCPRTATMQGWEAECPPRQNFHLKLPSVRKDN
jgi:hypothetical protein